MKWVVIGLTMMMAHPALAQSPKMPPDEINDCRLAAANTAIKIYPAYQIKTIGIPKPIKAFTDKDELGKPLQGWQYTGIMKVSVGNMDGEQFYGCTFVKDAEEGWIFSWAGLRHRVF